MKGKRNLGRGKQWKTLTLTGSVFARFSCGA